MKLILLLAFVSSSLISAGQKITRAEYFIDSDPGFGKATTVAISTPASDLTLSFNVNISTLAEGFHIMVLRAKDDKGFWSVAQQQVFYVFKTPAQIMEKLARAEYFIDSDPGFGKATGIAISTPGSDLSLSFNVDINSLSEDFHIIVLRARDERGYWSVAQQQVFYVFKHGASSAAKIIGIEYFIDNDPGFGKGTWYPIPVPATDVEAEFTVSLTGVTSGNHIICFRAKDETGQWTQLYSHAVAVTVTGLDDMEATSWFRFYPNPNAGDFIMDFNDLQQDDVRVTIADMGGRVVYSTELSGESATVSVDLPSGIYMVTVESGGRTFKQKLLISR